jgi:flagellar M-ring protein FliF
MAENVAATVERPTPFSTSMEAFNRLTTQQKLAGMVGVALLIALLIGGMLWTKEPPYSILFANFDEKDGGAIVAALQQQNVPYQYAEGGRAILVPQAKVHDIRLKLASQGLPKGGLVGFEIMEGQKLGISQFAEQINYQRALEGELARSIGSLSAVRGARVHLAIPKQTAFLRDDTKTSASVVVSLAAGRTLESSQVAGIVHLVSSSVPQLNPLNVSVIDQNGNLISQQRDKLQDAGLDPSQLKYVRELESIYTKRIEAILAPIVGSSNVKAQVTADIDFSQTEQVAENYKPNPTPDTAIRSQQTTEAGTGTPGAIGVPGALTNQPPVPATAPLTTPAVPGAGGVGSPPSMTNTAGINYSRNATVNYEVDKTVRHTKGMPGVVRRLSVAVVVNHRTDPTKPKPVPLTETEIKQVTDLAREAMGFSQQRGDTLNVANAPFTAPDKEIVPDSPFWKDAELIALLKELARYLVIGGIAVYLWTRLLKPVVDKLLEPPPAPPEKEENDAEGVEIGPDGLPHLVHQNAHLAYENKLAAARELARKDPRAVANMIKEWMDGGEGK